jgi:transcriptional regulator with XRE-family HTH domain
MTPFGTLLRRYRTRAVLSQSELARRAGVDVAYVNRLESGKASRDPRTRIARIPPPLPSREIVLRLAAALALGRISADQFLIAADHCPEIVRRMSEQQLDALYVLASLSEPERLRALS